jgi:glucokinase
MPVSNAGLIADIGATNARFALADRNGISHEMVLPCADYPGVTDAIAAYYQKSGIDGKTIKAGAFDVAGPVIGDWFELTNHNWAFSIEQTRRALGFDTLQVMNDFEAVALAIPALHDKDIIKFGSGEKIPGKNIGVIGPGTGLGVAGLFWDGNDYIASPCEGGHVSVPVRTQREFDVIQNLLSEKYSHVSAERVCSGKGIVNIYDALRRIDNRTDLPDRDAKEISTAAITGQCAVCAETLELFTGFLGVVAGNLALTLDALGGIYIAGGIPVKLGEYFFTSNFRQRFEAKGRYEVYMKAIPTFLITQPFIAFVGLRHDLIRRGAI